MEIKIVEWREIEPEAGDLFTLEDWIGCVRSGGFIDYDGYGDLASADKVSNVEVQPSEVFEKGPGSKIKESFLEKTKGFTHVLWYNR